MTPQLGLFDECDTDTPCPPDEIPTEDEIPIEEEDPAPPAPPDPPADTHITTIYVYDPKKKASSCYTRETRYHVVDVLRDDSPEDALPDAPCSCCGGQRFIAKEDQLRHWRCIRCTPPCPNERVVVYDVPEEEEDDSDDEQADQ